MRRSLHLFFAACGLALGCASLVWAQTGGSGGSGGAAAGSAATGGVGTANPAQTQAGAGVSTQSGVTAGGQAATTPNTSTPNTTPVQPNTAPVQPGQLPQAGTANSATNNTNNLSPAQRAPNMNTPQSRTPAGTTTASGAATAGATTSLSGSASMGFSFTPGGNGLRIGSIATGGLAQNAGLQLNDDIVSINGQAVNSEAEMATVLQQAGESPLSFGVRRNGQLRMVTMSQAAARAAGSPGLGAGSGIGAQGFGSFNGIGGSGDVNNNPFRTSVPSAAGTVNANVALTGDFATDFSSWGLEMGTALQRQQNQFQTQINQLSQLNNRINALRMTMMNTTGSSANNVQVLEQLRRLRADVGMLSDQSSGEFQVQLNAMRDRLNRLNPSGAPSGTVTAGAAGSATINAAGSASSPSTTVPR